MVSSRLRFNRNTVHLIVKIRHILISLDMLLRYPNIDIHLHHHNNYYCKPLKYAVSIYLHKKTIHFANSIFPPDSQNARHDVRAITDLPPSTSRRNAIFGKLLEIFVKRRENLVSELGRLASVPMPADTISRYIVANALPLWRQNCWTVAIAPDLSRSARISDTFLHTDDWEREIEPWYIGM